MTITFVLAENLHIKIQKEFCFRSLQSELYLHCLLSKIMFTSQYIPHLVICIPSMKEHLQIIFIVIQKFPLCTQAGIPAVILFCSDINKNVKSVENKLTSRRVCRFAYMDIKPS